MSLQWASRYLSMAREYKNKRSWVFDYVADNNNNMQSIFMSHALCVKFAKSFDTEFLMNCTYKTNWLGMLLLVITEMTCFSTIFIARYVFLEENTFGYLWAMNTVLDIEGQHTSFSCITFATKVFSHCFQQYDQKL